jgi:hypothetical protein
VDGDGRQHILADPRVVTENVRYRVNDVQQQFSREQLHLWQLGDEGKVVDDQPQRVVLDVWHVHLVGSFKDLQHILVVDVVLQVVLAERLQSVVGEAVEARRLEQIQRILRRHFCLAVVNVAQQRVEGLWRWLHVADLDVDDVVGWVEGAEHRLEVGAACGEDRLVGGNDVAVENEVDVAELPAGGLQKDLKEPREFQRILRKSTTTHRHVRLQRRPARLIKLAVRQMLARVQLLPDHLDNQRLLQPLELRTHHDVLEAVVLHDEIQTIVLDRLQIQLVCIVESFKDVDLGDFELQVLHAELLQPGDLELLRQQINIHQTDDFLVERILEVDDVRVDVEENHLESVGLNRRQFNFKLGNLRRQLNLRRSEELLEVLIARLFSQKDLRLEVLGASCHDGDVRWNLRLVGADNEDDVVELLVHEELAVVF